MEIEDWASFSEGFSDSEVYLQDNNDEECLWDSGSMPKLQFRKDISKACWNDEIRMAEVLEKKGRIWTTTGIVRSSKTYCSVEETLYLAGIGALFVWNGEDMPLSLQDLYGKVTDESNGCCWEMFEAYKQLKSLGYIVARHGVHWTMKKNRKTDSKSDSLEGIPERKTEIARESEERHSLIKLFNNMQINEVKPVFDVYHPDSKFRKSSPGDPCFILCLARGLPPSKAEIEELESRCNGIPLKLCHVEHGRVSFFSFKLVELAVLP